MLIKRIGYYLVGLALGILGVSFFWKKKDVSFDYGMDARTLKTIRIRERLFSDNAKNVMRKFNIDTATVSIILKHGDVDFSKGKPREKPCAEYYITGKKDLEFINLLVKRCDSTSTIENIILVK